MKVKPSNIVSLRDFSQKSAVRRRVTENEEVIFIPSNQLKNTASRVRGFYVIPDTLFEKLDYDNDDDITNILVALTESPRMTEMEKMIDILSINGILRNPNHS